MGDTASIEMIQGVIEMDREYNLQQTPRTWGEQKDVFIPTTGITNPGHPDIIPFPMGTTPNLQALQGQQLPPVLIQNGGYPEIVLKSEDLPPLKVLASKYDASKDIPESKRKRTTDCDPVLPPCAICGAKASGYHFGAITCEACKVFFRRSLIKETSYYCVNGGKCKILPIRRIACSYCRLKKCIELGMSRDGIQRGRYTVERKTECIKKVKELEKHPKEKYQIDCGWDYKPGEPSLYNKILNNEIEMDKFVKAVVKADIDHPLADDDLVDRVLQSQASYLEYRKLKEMVFGPTKALSSEEYRNVYKNTGIDIDNRRQNFAKCMLTFATKITKFIEYAKSLPGFVELNTSDQIILLRESLVDWLIMSEIKMFNFENMVYTCTSCHQSWVLGIGTNKRFANQTFGACKALDKLNLRNDELAILKALILFNPDGSEGQITEKSFIEKYQDYLSQSLLITLRRNRDLDDRRLAILFGQIVHILTDLKEANLAFKQLMDEVMTHFSDIEYPELFIEILGDEIKTKLDLAREASNSLNSTSPHVNADIAEGSTPDSASASPGSIPSPSNNTHFTDSIFPLDAVFTANFLEKMAENSNDSSVTSSLVTTSDESSNLFLLSHV